MEDFVNDDVNVKCDKSEWKKNIDIFEILIKF